MSAFLNMRGTGDWATNEAPQDWAEYVLYEYPNGMAPLYAMQSMFGKDTVSSHTYNWWTESLPTRAGAASVYIDSALTTAYVYATHQSTVGITGKVVYVKVSAALAKEFVPGDIVLLRDASWLAVDVTGSVTDVIINGASSCLAVELNEDDDNAGDDVEDYNLATVDYIIKLGSAYPEFSDAPIPMGYKPTAYSNHPEIFRNTFALSGSAQAEILRTGDPYKQDKRRCVERHSMDIELSGWFHEKRVTTGLNNKPKYITQGLLPFMRENNPSAVLNYETTTATAYSGQTWLQAGKTFLNTELAAVFRYLSGEAVGWCGDGALQGIQDLAEIYGSIQLKVGEKSYGLRVVEWILPQGSLFLKTCPLFSRESTWTNMLVIGHPKNAKFCPKSGNGVNRDTKFQTNMQVPGQDGVLDGYMTEGGWKWHFPNQWRVLHGVGKDNIN